MLHTRALESKYEDFLCFYTVGLREGRLAEAQRRLKSSGAGRPGRPWATLVLGLTYSKVDASEAIRLFELAIVDFKSIGEDEGEVLAHQNLHHIFLSQGSRNGLRRARLEVVAAQAVASRSSSAIAKARAAVLEASHLVNTGGDYSRAHKLLLQVRRSVFPDGPIGLRRSVLFQLANLSQYLGKFDEAIEAMDAHADLRKVDNSISEAASVAFNRFNYRLTRSELDPRPGARERLLREAVRRLPELEELGRIEVTVLLERVIGNLILKDDSRAALKHLERCLALATRTGNREIESECLFSLARAVVGMNPEAAEKYLEDALVRSRLDDSLQAYANQARLRLVWQIESEDEALRSSLAALEAMETLRANQSDELARAQVFGAWTLDYRWLAGKLLSLPTPRLDQAFEVGERLRGRVLLEGLEGDRPTVGARFAKLAEIAPTLNPDEALVWFSIAPEQDLYGDFGGGAWRLLITREGTTLTRLPDAAGLSDRVAAFSSLLAERDADPEIWSTAATGLYASLFGPPFARLPPSIKRLTIAADGPLPRLPFEALRATAGAPTLGERFEIATVPSATIWLRLRRGPAREFARPALVLADPVAAKPLPWARKEARAIRRALGRATTRWEGGDASESRLVQTDLAPFAALHFAAHASADDAYPERSAILLAAGESSTAGNGHLEPHEIAKLALDGRIVVLSACDSASGALVSGEGFLSLARAFFQARARSVVAARWPIRDDDAAFLFDQFYRELGRGETVGAALRAARRAAIDKGLPPQAWAGVVLLGDAEARINHRAAGQAWWIVLAVLGVMLVFAAAGWSRIRTLRR